ncbi:glycosyltransferase family 9 protein [Elusimicrobiota bacterium]
MIKTDCKHFPLDRPCSFHKKSGIKCINCTHYAPLNNSSANKEILIIKLGAMGDVLRTTFLLKGLKQKYPNCKITWIVAKYSFDVLKNNPYIKEIWINDEYTGTKLVLRKFDIVINLDLSPDSISLATLAIADNKLGFTMDRKKRKVISSNKYAKHWLKMSSFDDVKKSNKNTYQYWMSKIVGLPKDNYEIFTPLNKKSLEKAKRFAKSKKIQNDYLVGINPGAGGRWKYKKWTNKGYVEIIKKLSDQKIKVLLFGGPEEKDLIEYLLKKSNNKAISTGTDNSLPDFFSLLNLCNVVITGDTLSLHAALGLKKKVLSVFGPTSANEIELYNRGVKVVTPAKCRCCYLPFCNVSPNCMDLISTQMVWSALSTLIPLRY